ncbi:hypothetical protein MPH_06142 [Macrophomina phaseolina MS6]|uniref:Uncharacterized protein n=1 Tax=Macrophomina phaseolina (strain MS6) TaxID=1126212 RepID=K2RPL3_MACPH|nr:hypothetical protein MPH_06142 [Macrophomina phaseolina MS6]
MIWCKTIPKTKNMKRKRAAAGSYFGMLGENGSCARPDSTAVSKDGACLYFFPGLDEPLRSNADRYYLFLRTISQPQPNLPSENLKEVVRKKKARRELSCVSRTKRHRKWREKLIVIVQHIKFSSRQVPHRKKKKKKQNNPNQSLHKPAPPYFLIHP